MIIISKDMTTATMNAKEGEGMVLTSYQVVFTGNKVRLYDIVVVDNTARPGGFKEDSTPYTIQCILYTVQYCTADFIFLL